MSIPITTLMCHAPIVVPPVGRQEGSACAATTAAMRTTAAKLISARPDVVVVVSPHTARTPDDWRLVLGERVRGDFAEFGAPHVTIDLPAAADARSRIARLGPQHGVQTALYQPERLDNGATVPLWFLREAGWNGPTLVIALPWREGTEALMGEFLRMVSGQQRWAIVASGDMSHRLRPGSPAGHHKDAQRFDAAVIQRLKAGDLRGVAELDPELRKIAAEDVVASVTVAAGATGWRADRHELLCYEAPFGVGYAEAVLYAER
jgi:aromatic ring-opening dioxygenase LigB subunit